ncbi:MAG: DUF4124 domain-containing protein [Candidatus Eutrophobiaceae bacterium]
MNYTRLIILSALFGLCSPLGAVIYKWTSEDGNVNYTQTPPPEGIDAQKIAPTPAPAGDPQPIADPITKAQQRNASREQEKAAKEQATDAAEEAKIRTSCANARKRLETFQNPRIRVNSADGTGKRLGEEERQAELKRAQDYINGNCQ